MIQALAFAAVVAAQSPLPVAQQKALVKVALKKATGHGNWKLAAVKIAEHDIGVPNTHSSFFRAKAIKIKSSLLSPSKTWLTSVDLNGSVRATPIEQELHTSFGAHNWNRLQLNKIKKIAGPARRSR